MPPPIPKDDGDVNLYDLTGSSNGEHQIYYVNGIQTTAFNHAVMASLLSLLIERPVWGVFNATAGEFTKLKDYVLNLDVKGLAHGVQGFARDVGQSGLDYAQNAGARIVSKDYKPPKVTDDKIHKFLEALNTKYVVWNRATLTLFQQLITYRKQSQKIIAHSQGNLITSNALFAMEDVLGTSSLKSVRVYSLASPSPGWPLGLRVDNDGGGRQDNGFMNDLVILLRPHNLARKLGIKAFQNAGDFQLSSLSPHSLLRLIETTNFLKSIRKDVNNLKEFTPEFLVKCRKTAEAAFGK